jgi:hypothetical protein
MNGHLFSDMKDIAELLNRIIIQETKNVESIRNSLKEGELTILRLQNKSRSLEIEFEERKQLIKEYRSCLQEILETAQAKKQLVASTKQQIDTGSSTTQMISKLVKKLEKQRSITTTRL